MTVYVLDTNIVSKIVRQDALILAQFTLLLKPDNVILGCPVVWFEVQRGLRARDAKLQMRHFEELFATFEWQDYGAKDWSLAADWWVKRRLLGLPVGDADLLIAVFAANRQAVLVTNNEKDFVGLLVTIENWTQSS